MSAIVLVVLIGAWALVLGPVLLRDARGPVSTTLYRALERARSVVDGRSVPLPGRGRMILAPPKQPYPVNIPKAVPGRKQSRSAAQRRRLLMTRLAAFIVVTFFLGLIPPLRILLYPCLGACVLMVLYVGAAVWFAARAVPAPPKQSREVTSASAAGSAG